MDEKIIVEEGKLIQVLTFSDKTESRYEIGDAINTFGKRRYVNDWEIVVQIIDPEGKPCLVCIPKKHLIGTSKKPLQELYSHGWDGSQHYIKEVNRYLLEQFKTAPIVTDEILHNFWKQRNE